MCGKSFWLVVMLLLDREIAARCSHCWCRKASQTSFSNTYWSIFSVFPFPFPLHASQAIPRAAQGSVAACVSSLVVAGGDAQVAKTVAACLSTVNASGSSTAARRLALLVLGKIGAPNAQHHSKHSSFDWQHPTLLSTIC